MSPSKDVVNERPPASSRAGRSWRIGMIVVASASIALAVFGYIQVSTRATDRGSDTLGAAEATPSWRGPDTELRAQGSVEVDGVELTASGVQCGLPRHDWQGGSASASGQFCVMDVLLENSGESPLPIAPSLFQLLDGDGVTTVAHEQLTAYGTDLHARPPSAAQLAGGAATRIHLVFDVPDAATGPMELRFAPTARLKITI